LQIIGAAFNENAAQLVPPFIAQFHPTFPIGFVGREQVRDYIQHPPSKPSYVPELIFIDRNRVIRGQYSGADDFFKDQDKNTRTLLDTLLKEKQPASAKKNGQPARKRRS
jgi:hypothetical protein